MAGGANRLLSEVVRAGVEAGVADLHVALPGRIERFDPATMLADVKPMIADARTIDDKRTPLPFPVIPNVPVQFPGGGGFRITFPVQPGDACVLIFSDRSLDLWVAKGGEVDPVDDRRHALTDAIALLGVKDAAHPWGNVSTDALTIGHDASGPRAEFREDEIRLDGGTAKVAREGDAVRKATRMAQWISDVTSALTGTGNASRIPGLTSPSDFGIVDEGAERVKA